MRSSSSDAAPATVYLSLGSNQGDRQELLLRAIDETEKRIGHVTAQSAFIVTRPWGFDSDNDFLNACIAVETMLTPMQLLRKTQTIERLLGRTEKTTQPGQYHDRPIDIDILFYADGRMVQTDKLTIPHPRMAERMFVLQPLDEIAHSVRVPGSDRSVGEMRSALEARS